MLKVKLPTASLRFLDEDNDPLTVEIFCYNNNVKQHISACADYLYFDSKRLFFTATPQKYSNIPYEPAVRQYFHQSVLLIRITDTNDEFAETDFSVIVLHRLPTVNLNYLSIQQQYNNLVSSQQIVAKPFRLTDFTFSASSFRHEATNIQYQASYRVVTSEPSPYALGVTLYHFGEWQPISLHSSFWLKFDAVNRKFQGIPDETQLGSYEIQVNADDGIGFDYQRFFVNVTNQNPALKGAL